MSEPSEEDILRARICMELNQLLKELEFSKLNYIPPSGREQLTCPSENINLNENCTACVKLNELDPNSKCAQKIRVLSRGQSVSKKLQYAYIAQGGRINCAKHKTFAMQTATITNPNIQNLDNNRFNLRYTC